MTLPGKPYLFWGKYPTAIFSAIAIVLDLLVTYNAPITHAQAGLISFAIDAVATAFIAWRTRHPSLAVALGAINAVVAVAIGFGLHISPEQVGLLASLATTLYAVFYHTQTSPTDAHPGNATVEPQPLV